MGEHQCPHCGHITTGFEQQQFEAQADKLRNLLWAAETLRGIRMLVNLTSEQMHAIDDAIILAKK